jgi:hypothetical protein
MHQFDKRVSLEACIVLQIVCKSRRVAALQITVMVTESWYGGTNDRFIHESL